MVKLIQLLVVIAIIAAARGASAQAPTPVSVGSYAEYDDEDIFHQIAEHCAGSADGVKSGKDILDLLKKKTGDGNCIRTWIHAQHSWGENSASGKEHNGGLGGGVDANGTGFYGKPPTDAQKKDGGHSLDDLQAMLTAGSIKFCKPCRIYIYGCRVSSTGSFAANLSKMTGCSVYAAKGACSTTHPDKQAGTGEDPWRSEGGWEKWDNGTAAPVQDGNDKHYITPTTKW